ncbi:hypothetical protein CDL15_Pgr023387 [Punica granatum]|uniref:Protein RALF-like 19 n=1 Tax=Punica granatum TaxID=22663 RepID=A0A218Y1G4_PUNGR|nr:hypothetical protein CDL15_Pgr023387 [Punica granatum]PKI51318.1 hypothetical protein CRG98_028265 [Punica granatum]
MNRFQLLLILFATLSTITVMESLLFNARWVLDYLHTNRGKVLIRAGSFGTSPRKLVQKARYISYDALKKNSIPCSQRGQSYYNCEKQGEANPYKRGCSVITHCARFTD